MIMRPNISVSVLLLSLALAGCKSNPAAESPAPASAPSQSANDQSANPQSASPQPTPAPAQVSTPAPVIPAGTRLSVKLATTLGSKISHVGDPFQATTASSIRIGGDVVVPAGSSVSGVVVDAKERGKIKGQGELSIRLTGINLKGRYYPIETAVLSQWLKGKGKRTAATTGGGAGAGALIGALAGGGKGAGIGALVGAGAGFAGGAFSGNKQIELPAETLLTFTLKSSLPLRAD